MDNAKDIMLIESVIKLAAINKLLVKKGIITDQELIDEMQTISKDLVTQMKGISPELFVGSNKVS